MREALARLKVAGRRRRTTATTSSRSLSRAAAGDAGSRIIGYRATNIIQARTHDVAGIGRLVDAAVAAGANVVRSLRFSLDPPDRAEADARRLALQDAASKAQQLAAAAGVKLGRLLAVTESSGVSGQWA